MFVLMKTRPIGRSDPGSAVNADDCGVLADVGSDPVTVLDGPFILDLPDVGFPSIAC